MEETRKGFISMDKTLALLKKHSKKKPLLDLAFMAVNRDYVEHGHNFSIPLREKTADGKIVDRGTVWVEVKDDKDKFNLRAEIKAAVKRTMDLDINFDYNDVKRTNTIIDPDNNPQGRPTNIDPLGKVLGYERNQGDLV